MTLTPLPDPPSEGQDPWYTDIDNWMNGVELNLNELDSWDTDHVDETGNPDPHPQYLNETRGDDRYSFQGHSHEGGAIDVDSLPMAIPATITFSTSWPARTTATSQATRRVFFIGDPTGSGPNDMAANDVWMRG